MTNQEFWLKAVRRDDLSYVVVAICEIPNGPPVFVICDGEATYHVAHDRFDACYGGLAFLDDDVDGVDYLQ